MTPEELRMLDNKSNEKIWEAIAVETVETDIDTAKEMGAIWPSLVKYAFKKFVL